ncbi:hypothetical protein JTB14_000271 [Gonioctena quinquepunctata]|nr:hypothetical protein JTB14_000271 [Gonioctena quinquepunctata]
MGLLEYIGKKYKLNKSENFDDYMKALGKMEDEISTICRLCLKIISPNIRNNKLQLESSLSQKLSLLFPDKTLYLFPNDVVCPTCAEQLQSFHDFKLKCLEKEENIRVRLNSSNDTKLELHKILFASENRSEEIKLICRLCYASDNVAFTKMDIFNDEELGQLLIQCLPEIDATSICDPSICQNCLEILKNQHLFIQKCLEVEEKITNHLAQLGISNEQEDSVEILRFLAQTESSNNTVFIKTEEVENLEIPLEGMAGLFPAHNSEVSENSVRFKPNPATIGETGRVYSCKKCDFKTSSDSELKYHFVEEHKGNGRINMHVCQFCPFVTRHWNVINNHRLIHLSEDEIVWLECPSCTYRTKLKGNLEKHMLTHNAADNVKRFQCKDCPYTSNWKRDLERHLLKHAEGSQITRYNCHLCAFSTKHQRYLKFHVLKVHLGEEKTDETYYCAQCSFSTKQKRSLVPHMLMHRNPEELVSHQCRFCSYQSKWKKSVKLHEEIHIKTFKCDKCDFETKQKRFLREHLRGHEPLEQPTVYTCEECGFKTTYKNGMVKHGLVHKKPEEIDMHCCLQCEYKAKRSRDLKQHVYTIHTDDVKIHQCDMCSYKTKYKSGLSSHKKLQHKNPDEIRIFRCTSCPFITKYKSSFLVHEEAFHKKFDEEALLKCSECDYKTKRRDCLQKHRVRHETNFETFKCNNCSFESKYKRALQRHLTTHRKKELMRCGKCDFTTTWKGSLKKHKQKHFEEVTVDTKEIFMKEEPIDYEYCELG